MTITAGADDLQQSYEALRAQALGQETAMMPRGLVLLLHAGMVAWMTACAPVASLPATAKPGPSIKVGKDHVLAGRSAELVRVLAEMAVGSQRRLWA